MILVDPGDTFAHRVDPVGEREPRVQALVKLRQRFDRERSACARHLNDQQDHCDGLADVSEEYDQRVNQIRKDDARGELPRG